MNTTTRILVVEDFKSHRHLIGSLLGRNPGLDVIAEASDGEEGVTLAQQLTPDLILLDIGLPKLNGLEVARQISALVPSAKIVFFTQERDVDIVRIAFILGAWGFVLKQDAEPDLLKAVNSVREGVRFVSRGLANVSASSFESAVEDVMP
jgi:DNA-binding NarL/FixJ family response regulator